MATNMHVTTRIIAYKITLRFVGSLHHFKISQEGMIVEKVSENFKISSVVLSHFMVSPASFLL